MSQLDPPSLEPMHAEKCPADVTRFPVTGPARENLIESILSKLASDSRKARYIVAALLMVLTIELMGAIVATGCPTPNAMVWDVATMFDGGWRLFRNPTWISTRHWACYPS